MSPGCDPVRALEAVAEAAREYVKFVIFKPDRPAAAARERLEEALADYDALVSTPTKEPS